MNDDIRRLLEKMNQPRTYRSQFNTSRFTGFTVQYLETDLWIGVDPQSYNPAMEEVALTCIKNLRNKLDEYIKKEPFFKKSLKPFEPSAGAPDGALEMAKAAARADVGPMASVAGYFARETGDAILQNFSAGELVIENGGDIYAMLNDDLVLSVYAGESPLSERVALVIKANKKRLGICTSAGTVGPSLSFGKADALVVIAEDVLLADAFATAFGNKVKKPDDVEKVINQCSKYPEILSMLIICDDKIGIKGEYEIKILK